ncbi:MULTISPECIES: NUDIX domain-containing protein [unclassified Streptomyces]|uniref:NUDIX domain-containing protein n=1 Tax=unclassified Streptomyces TaxID=2593676 RepID=UPI001F18E285|nr:MULTISPECIES: NUDIX domain-containing protein [unclassified Streptomyces]
MHVTAGALLVRDGGEVLLIEHRAYGITLQPGGHLEAADTTLLGAAMRKLSEETGIDPELVVRARPCALPAPTGTRRPPSPRTPGCIQPPLRPSRRHSRCPGDSGLAHPSRAWPHLAELDICGVRREGARGLRRARRRRSRRTRRSPRSGRCAGSCRGTPPPGRRCTGRSTRSGSNHQS